MLAVNLADGLRCGTCSAICFAYCGKLIVLGHTDIVDGVLTCLFVGGHALLEGVPGLGKTLLVRTLSQVLDLHFNRIQFTPDVMPADVIGTNVINEAEVPARVQLPARSDLHPDRAGRRDQPGHAENAVVMSVDHARTIASAVGGAELTAVHDKDIDRARRLARPCGDARVVETAGELIADPKIDAVLVSSPDETHAPLAIACIAAGKPALVEKPLASTLDECRAVISAEMKGGRGLIQVGFMRRFGPGYLAMKEALVRNRLGSPLFFHCVHRNAVGPEYHVGARDREVGRP